MSKEDRQVSKSSFFGKAYGRQLDPQGIGGKTAIVFGCPQCHAPRPGDVFQNGMQCSKCKHVTYWDEPGGRVLRRQVIECLTETINLVMLG